MVFYCTKGHENPTGNRFCQHCGERLPNSSSYSIISPGMILEERYRVVREIGHGGFGRTYLAEDLNRFKENCVLKEFAPQVLGSYALQKAEELFEREAGVLYKLQHPQIPRFREMFRVTQSDGIGRLFLVQDYVEGQTYRVLLETRKLEQKRFSEGEATQLLMQMLPILRYIHSLGVIHRDISPDNLILRSSDQLPVLIDFGGVKQVAATVVSQFNQPVAANPTTPNSTRLGKIGYAPDEQMQRGIVSPNSDLYALAATVLVLLTGKEPQQLIDQQTLAWNWRREISLGPTLTAILDKMLAIRPSDRYQSATEVLQALTFTPPSASLPPLPPPPTQAVTPTPTPQLNGHANTIPEQTQSFDSEATTSTNNGVEPTQINTEADAPASALIGVLGKVLLFLVVIVVAGSLGWWGGNLWVKSTAKGQHKQPQAANFPSSSPSNHLTAQPQQSSNQQWQQRLQNLGINGDFFARLVNEEFWRQNPNQRGRNLTNRPEDEKLRTQWEALATEMLNKLEQANLSIAARRRLGTYKVAERNTLIEQVNRLRLSSRTLYDLVDAQFSSFFPNHLPQNLQLSFEDFLRQPIGQVWQAIATDKVKNLENRQGLETIGFNPGKTEQQVNGNLKPGEGKVYIAQLNAGQTMQLQLQTNQKALLSLYSPTGKNRILEDSLERGWSGKLPESGYYEFVIVSTASQPIDYQLKLTMN